jgi:hypothetical protein
MAGEWAGRVWRRWGHNPLTGIYHLTITATSETTQHMVNSTQNVQ